jgi:hypothetical protein
LKKLLISIFSLIIFVTTFSSCDDDSIFYPKVKTANGVTTVSGIRAGGLEKALLLRMRFVTYLVINDTIDSRDFETMRDEMPSLTSLDLSNATIAAYNGYEGAGDTKVYRYAADAIPEYAFYNPLTTTANKTLSFIKLPNNIKSIKDFAFNRCSGLSGTLVIPASVKDTIGKSAFAFCENLTGLTLAPTKYIAESAFQGCTNLSGALLISDSTFTIKPYAFAGCEKITSISISKNVSDIGTCAFYDCKALFTVDAANTTYLSSEGVLFNVDQSILVQFPKGKTGNYILPSSVSSISPYAFANCSGLSSVTIPATTSSIEDYAFSGCSGLSGNFIIPSGLSNIGMYVFDDCSKISGFTVDPLNTTFSFSEGALLDTISFILKRCVQSKSGAYTVPSNITSIDNSAFSNCALLTSVTIPETVSIIGKRAFYNCSGLTSIYAKAITPIDLSGSITAFDGVNFEKCFLHVPKTTSGNYSTAIGWNVFYNIIEN